MASIAHVTLRIPASLKEELDGIAARYEMSLNRLISRRLEYDLETEWRQANSLPAIEPFEVWAGLVARRRANLRKAVAESGRSLGEEVERRLERSVEQDRLAAIETRLAKLERTAPDDLLVPSTDANGKITWVPAGDHPFLS